MPGANQTHYSQVLSDVAIQFKPPALAQDLVVPPVKVNHEQDVYPVFSKDLFDVVDDLRADGDKSNETTLGWKYEAYQCEERALHDTVTKRERDNADDPDDLEAAKAENVKQQVLNGFEKRIFGTGGLARTAANFINSRNLDWTNPSSASPRTDIDNLKNDVETNAGISPNCIVLTPQVGRAIMRTAEWRDEAKYTNDLRADNDIPTQLYGLRVILVESLINSGVKGQATSLGRLMGEDIIVAYINDALPYRGLTWAVKLYTEEYVNKWYEDDRRADVIEYGQVSCLKIVARECAALGTSVLTS